MLITVGEISDLIDCFCSAEAGGGCINSNVTECVTTRRRVHTKGQDGETTSALLLREKATVDTSISVISHPTTHPFLLALSEHRQRLLSHFRLHADHSVSKAAQHVCTDRSPATEDFPSTLLVCLRYVRQKFNV